MPAGNSTASSPGNYTLQKEVAMAPHGTTIIYLGLISLGFIIAAYGTIVGAAGGFLYVPLLFLLYPAVTIPVPLRPSP